jgi:hypothetical protein
VEEKGKEVLRLREESARSVALVEEEKQKVPLSLHYTDDIFFISSYFSVHFTAGDEGGVTSPTNHTRAREGWIRLVFDSRLLALTRSQTLSARGEELANRNQDLIARGAEVERLKKDLAGCETALAQSRQQLAVLQVRCPFFLALLSDLRRTRNKSFRPQWTGTNYGSKKCVCNQPRKRRAFGVFFSIPICAASLQFSV